MDGRLTLNIPLSEFEKTTGIKIASAEVKTLFANPLYNIAPTAFLPVTTNLKPSEITLLKWGLIPAWSTTSKNAKGLTSISVTAFESKPALQQAIYSKRCLIWSNGFYLWKETNAGKIPFYVMLKSKECFAIAGLWEAWDGESNNTCCVITKDSSSLLPFFKSQMPIVLSSDKRIEWLSGNLTNEEVLEALNSNFESSFEYFPVSRKILKSTENDPKFIQKVPYLVAEQTNMFL